MDIPRKNSEEASSEAEDSEVEISVFKNSVILRHILRFLPLKTLLTCSLLNRYWNLQVRPFIRDFRKCNAYISGPSPCVQLKQLHEDLEKMNLVPFNGLVLNLKEYNDATRKCPNCHELNSLECRLLGDWLPRFISINWKLYFLPGSCPPVKVVEKLVYCKAAGIERLKLEDLHSDFDLNFDEDGESSVGALAKLKITDDDLFSVRVLPKLKTLESGQFGIDEWLLTKILHAAPNLRSIRVLLNPRTLRIIPKTKWNLIHHFELILEEPLHVEQCLEFMEIVPKLRRLVITCPDLVYPLQYPQILGNLLLSSLTSITQLDLSNCDDLICCGFHFPAPLLNVRRLRLNFSTNLETFIGILHSLNYDRLFPTLKSVEISIREDGSPPPSRLPYIRAFASPDFGPSQTAQSLEIHSEGVKPEEIEELICVLQEIFPGIRRLKIERPVPLRKVFDCWKRLEGLDLELERQNSTILYDSDFCGIAAEEVQELGRESRDFLSNVQVVPVRSCLATLLHMQELRIRVREFRRRPDLPFFSELTRLIAIGRMPALSVSVTQD